VDLIEYWKGEQDALKQRSRDLTDQADAEGRGLNDEERAEVSKALNDIAEYEAKITAEREKRDVRKLVDGFDASQASTDPVVEDRPVLHAKTMGDALVESEQFRALQAKWKDEGRVEFKSVAVTVPYETYMRAKAAGDPVLESDSTDVFGTGGAAGQLSTQVSPVWPLQPSNVIADLIPSLQITTGNSAYWLEMETRTAISGTPQTEGNAKPGGEYVTKVNSAALETYAGWIKISEQYIEDASAVVTYINQDLPYQVQFNENAAFMADLYTAAGLSADGTGLQTTPNAYDAIREAKALIQENHGTATGLIISPTDWATMETEKFGTDYGYIGGGPGQNPWGLQVVVTPAATDGLPMVGDFRRAARIFRKGGVRVSSTNSDGTDFQKNIVTFRAETRAVLGVSYPYLLSVAVIGTS
jgi:HK97 family phage major capsid protein